jgi:hypothetical protein
MTSLLPRHGFLISNPFPGADGASPSNFWMGPRWSKTAGLGPPCHHRKGDDGSAIPCGMAGEKTPYSNLGRLGILSKWASRE